MPFPSSLRLSLALLVPSLFALAACGGNTSIPPVPPEDLPPPVAVATSEPRPVVTLQVAGAAPETPVPLPPFDCAQGGELVTGAHRYCLYTAAASWAAAEARCQAHGGHLATVRGPDEERALFDALGNPAAPATMWIGLAEPAEGRWLWSSAARVGFTAWNTGEPNNAGGNENCGEWIFPNGRWNDLDCLTDRPFLCETRLSSPKARPPACAGKSFLAGGSAYCFHTDAELTWEKAQQRCARDGGTLAVIETAEENQAIGLALGARPVQVSGSMWLGLNDRAQEGAFSWSSGDALTHRAFRGGEPNNVGDEDCVEWSPTDGKWNDLSCDIPLASLCEAPPGAPTSPAVLAWLGMSEDRVGEGSFVPNGKLDGHFRLSVPRGGQVSWISVASVNAFGNPEGGQLWHTADPHNWVIGVLVDGQVFTRTLGMPLGAIRAGATLDLFCSDSGFFKPGQRFAVEVVFTDGLAVKRLVELPAQRTW